MGRTGKDKDLHDSMVKAMIKALKHKEIEVLKADVEGYERPDEIDGYIPDVVGKKESGTIVVVEVETCESVNSDHTKEQFKAFSNADGEFWVDVPESCLEKLKKNVKAWKVIVNKWYYRKGE